jgi:hypothetical protein
MAQVQIKSPDPKARPELWALIEKPLEGCFGYCDYERKELQYAPGMPLLDILDTIVHETIHAVLPDLKESAVKRTAKAVIAVLVAMPQLKISIAEDE